MTNSIMVSVHVLQTCHHLMGYSLLCTAIAMVPYFPSSLASTSFSFHYCLYSFVQSFPSHGIFIRAAPGCGLMPGVMHPLGWVLWEAVLSSLFKLSEGSVAQEPGASPAMEWDAHVCILRISQTRSQTFQRQNISHLRCLTCDFFFNRLFIP